MKEITSGGNTTIIDDGRGIYSERMRDLERVLRDYGYEITFRLDDNVLMARHRFIHEQFIIDEPYSEVVFSLDHPLLTISTGLPRVCAHDSDTELVEWLERMNAAFREARALLHRRHGGNSYIRIEGSVLLPTDILHSGRLGIGLWDVDFTYLLVSIMLRHEEVYPFTASLPEDCMDIHCLGDTRRAEQRQLLIDNFRRTEGLLTWD